MASHKWKAELKRTLFQFVCSTARNLTIYQAPVKLYVRRSHRLPGDCLDLATIDVDPWLQRKGYCRATVALFEEVAKAHKLSVYVECVQNEVLRNALERYGYTKLNTSATLAGIVPNYFKKV